MGEYRLIDSLTKFSKSPLDWDRMSKPQRNELASSVLCMDFGDDFDDLSDVLVEKQLSVAFTGIV